jgi:hypothetical protein
MYQWSFVDDDDDDDDDPCLFNKYYLRLVVVPVDTQVFIAMMSHTRRTYIYNCKFTEVFYTLQKLIKNLCETSIL